MQLNRPIGDVPLVGQAYTAKLRRLNIESVGDLLHHLPHRYLDFRNEKRIADVKVGEMETIKGEIVSIKNIYTKTGKKMQTVELKDASGKTTVVWFNQPYLINSLAEGETLSVSGRVGFWQRRPAFLSPEYEKVTAKQTRLHTGRLVPVYPETNGVSSKWLRRRINDVFSLVRDEVEEFLPQETLKRYGLVELTKAFSFVHFPQNHQEAEEGRERLAFNELLFLHLKSLKRKKAWQENRVSHKLKVDTKALRDFFGSLNFELTPSQERSVAEILEDLKKDRPMNRLLEGDVGSGKTIVAAVAAFVAFTNGFQTAVMAPTQILAEQHFTTLNHFLSRYKVRTSLITSAEKKADFGKTDLFVGTHALIHQKAKFDQVALVVIDEQHRFGVKERARLAKKAGRQTKAPHILTMTATPIPRSIALCIYGDLDLSTLTEMPLGRQAVTTWVVPPDKEKEAFLWLEKKLKAKATQAFVVCPLIEESEKESMKQIKAASQEYKRLKKEFPQLTLNLLHGRLKTKEKSRILTRFKQGKTDLLVTTPVVEVGIDVTNATVMVIEAAERFGLAQLHQLRGRVGRGEKKSYCLLMSESQSRRVVERLSALKRVKSGFELAELDLKLRGPGEIFGTRQHGFVNLSAASWEDTSLIKTTKVFAEEVIRKPGKYENLLGLIDEEGLPN